MDNSMPMIAMAKVMLSRVKRDLNMLMVERFLSSFDRKIISENRNKYKPYHIT